MTLEKRITTRMSSRSASENSKASGKSDDEEKIPNISSSDVAEKYKTAAKITNDTMKIVLSHCVAGASVVDVCQMGDNMILQKTSEFAKKATYKKGIAFPTSLSINGHLAHFSPLRANDVSLKNGDLVKLELGTHVDGYIAISAQSFIVGASKDAPATGKKADVILSAYYGAEAAIRALKVGTPGQNVADVVQNVANEFECKPVENMLFYAMGQNKLEGDEGILINGSVEGRKEHNQPEVKEYDVYAIDVLVSSGKGTAKLTELDTTIYKLENVHYSLKSKRSRHFFNYANSQFGLMPFNLRYFETDENNVSVAMSNLPKLKTKDNKPIEVPDFVTSKMGIKECREHGLLTQFDVQHVEENEFVAQFKFTVFVHSRGPERITFVDFDPSLYKSEFSIKDESLNNLLKAKVDGTKKKRKKKPASGGVPSGDSKTTKEPAALNKKLTPSANHQSQNTVPVQS